MREGYHPATLPAAAHTVELLAADNGATPAEPVRQHGQAESSAQGKGRNMYLTTGRWTTSSITSGGERCRLPLFLLCTEALRFYCSLVLILHPFFTACW